MIQFACVSRLNYYLNKKIEPDFLNKPGSMLFLGYVDKKDTHAHGANRIEAYDYIDETVKIAFSITENAFI